MRLRLTIMAGLATLLASIGLYPLFETSTWFGTGFGAVCAVAATGLLTRRFRLPALLCLAAGLLALLLYLTVMFVPDKALLGFVPTPGSVRRLAQMTSDGWHAANTYAAPVPVLPGIDLITGTGVGIVAVLVDFLAARLRRAAPAGLPLLAMYSVPAAGLQQRVSWLAFLLGAAGYLALLVADSREQLAGWGRPVFTRRWSGDQRDRERPDSSPLAAAGRRVGMAALAVAVVVPMATPGIHPKGLFGLGGNATGHGTTTITTPNPLVSLKRQLVSTGDSVVLTYRTTDQTPPDYLRIYALDRFDGEGWTYSPMRGDKNARIAGKNLPAPPGLQLNTAAQRVTTKISIAKQVSGMNVLPTPYPPTRVDMKGDWRVDGPSLMVFSLRDSAGGRSYTVDSLHTTPNYQQLITAPPVPEDIRNRYLELPRQLPPEVGDLALKLTASARTPYEKALKLQAWFLKPGNFTYSLNTPPPRSADALREFLFTSRTGYCEQFAASMAMLARAVGIPARVGMGFTAGARQSDGTWVVRTKDTHAWPELYFSGAGWLRFEPTPAGTTGQGSATVPSYSLPLAPTLPAPGSTQSTAPNAPAASPGSTAGITQRHRDDLQGQGSGTAKQPSTASRLPIGWLILAVAVLMLLALPVSLRLLTRRRRFALAYARARHDMLGPVSVARGGSPPSRSEELLRSVNDAAVAHAAWDELRDDVRDYGLPWRASDSPRAAARRITESITPDEHVTQALNRLGASEEHARYARTPTSTAHVREDLRLAHTAISASATPLTRWRARLAPPSSLARLRRTGTRALDLFDALDITLARLRNHLPRRR